MHFLPAFFASTCLRAALRVPARLYLTARLLQERCTHLPVDRCCVLCAAISVGNRKTFFSVGLAVEQKKQIGEPTRFSRSAFFSLSPAPISSSCMYGNAFISYGYATRDTASTQPTTSTQPTSRNSIAARHTETAVAAGSSSRTGRRAQCAARLRGATTTQPVPSHNPATSFFIVATTAVSVVFFCWSILARLKYPVAQQTQVLGGGSLDTIRSCHIMPTHRVARCRFDHLLPYFAGIFLSFVLPRQCSRYRSFLSTYAVRIAAFPNSSRRLYSVSFHIVLLVLLYFFSCFLVVLVLLCSRTPYAGLSLA